MTAVPLSIPASLPSASILVSRAMPRHSSPMDSTPATSSSSGPATAHKHTTSRAIRATPPATRRRLSSRRRWAGQAAMLEPAAAVAMGSRKPPSSRQPMAGSSPLGRQLPIELQQRRRQAAAQRQLPSSSSSSTNTRSSSMPSRRSSSSRRSRLTLTMRCRPPRHSLA